MATRAPEKLMECLQSRLDALQSVPDGRGVSNWTENIAWCKHGAADQDSLIGLSKASRNRRQLVFKYFQKVVEVHNPETACFLAHALPPSRLCHALHWLPYFNEWWSNKSFPERFRKHIKPDILVAAVFPQKNRNHTYSSRAYRLEASQVMRLLENCEQVEAWITLPSDLKVSPFVTFKCKDTLDAFVYTGERIV